MKPSVQTNMKTQKQINRPPAMKCAAIFTLACLVSIHRAAAATDTWNGGAVPNGGWLTPGNWNGVTPATNDLLIFAGSTQTKATNNFTAGFPFENLSFNSGASAFTLTGNTLTLSSPTDAGSGTIANGNLSSASASAETISLPVVMASGLHKISTSGAGVLKLNGALTHGNGAVAVFSGNINATGGLTTNGASYGILGGWAALASGDWATLDANSNIVAYTTYVTNAAGTVIANNPAANIKIPQNGSANSVNTGVTTINSLVFGNGASTTSSGTQVINIGAGNTLVLGQNGGIYNSTSLGQASSARQLTIGASVAAGGSLTAGDGINPATITLGDTAVSPAGTYATVVLINSVITDNNLLGNHAPVTVVMAGSYFSMNGGGNAATVNTYSGGTYILQGRCSQPGRNTFGTGPVYILPGGQANCGTQQTNDFYIAGSGSLESGGMGALRLYSASLASGYTGNMTGTVHLMANANICADNISVQAQDIGISGKITGPGGLGIGSPTATSRSGIINIGSTNGTFDIPNDYAGDTTINGITAGSVSSILEICNPADTNIMPHGAAGSYAGGPTGNLILNGVASSRQAIFELNGSTQTINGLKNTATSPANDIVQDTTGGGLLILGDNNATATYNGIIQSSLPITKIGNGTETLSGANTYTGNTIIQAGTLVTTTASTGPGNYSVSNNAALGVTTATAGGTLQVNNLTFGASGTSLNLSAGTLGDPSAAVVNVTGALNLNGNVNISLSGVGLTAGGPFTVMTYVPGSRTGSGIFVLNNSPRVVTTLNDDTVNGIVSITIISADTGVKWLGGVAGNWDINDTGNSIWKTFPSGNSAYYIESGSGNDSVIFDDFLTGTNVVTLATNVSPQAITISNTATSYLLTGSGGIGGSAGLTKNGNNAFIIANSGNNTFSGPIALNSGSLVISNTSLMANTLTGGGSLVMTGNGTLTMNGDSTGFNGPVSVNSGTLSVQNSISLATASSTTISSGGALDIANNNVALAQEPITASGSGVGGNGAIINSSGYGFGAIATSFQNLTMAGDITIGGPGRLDFRSTDPNAGTDAVLSTGGHAYNLTKVSSSILQLASVQVDNALANINVQAGTLGLSGNMPSLGNPSSTLTVSGAAILQFNTVGSTLVKSLFLNDGAIVNNSGGADIFGGLVTLQGNDIFNIAGTSLTFTNILSGSGTLNKVTGASPLYLAASNTYTGNTVISAGSLFLTEPGAINYSGTITIGTGTTMDVTGRNDQTLTLQNGQSLTGGGTLNGNLVTSSASTVAPGSPTTLGQLTVNDAATLGGTNIIKLVETNMTSDVLAVGGALQLGGTLQLVNLAGTVKSGDLFPIFTAGGGFTGSFAAISPATPGANYTWDTNTLATTGVLGVIYTGNTSPTNIVTTFDGVNLTLTWPMDHGGWRLQTQTNSLSTGLSTNWSDVPNSSSTNQVVIPVGSANGAVFYRMVYP
jgi:autotransporter-associated beta strand protein